MIAKTVGVEPLRRDEENKLVGGFANLPDATIMGDKNKSKTCINGNCQSTKNKRAECSNYNCECKCDPSVVIPGTNNC